ncbi:hypothetical protein Hanom_Chr10g00917291 [Helianthus anomalus]
MGQHSCLYCTQYLTIFISGSILITTLMNSLSRNGTRASTPQVDVDLGNPETDPDDKIKSLT